MRGVGGPAGSYWGANTSWLVAVALLLPQAVKLTKRSGRHLLRRPDEAEAAGDHERGAVYLDRGVSVLLFVGAALFLMRVWRIDAAEMTPAETRS